MILAEGPETVGAFIAEPVMGAGGAILPPTTYFDKIQAVLQKYEILFIAGDVRGTGLVTGIDIVADKRTRAMFDPEKGVSAMIERNLRKHGLTLRQVGNRIAFLPPPIIAETEIDEMASRLSRALDDTLAEVETG